MNYRSIFLSLATGVLLWLAWPDSSLTFLIFFAWIPLLFLAQEIHSLKKFFLLCYVSLFIWNIGTTWWIWNASAPGAVAAWLINSLLMCFPWLVYYRIQQKKSFWFSGLSLIAFWLCFEYIHLQDWGLSWPWLTLGNVFANQIEWVQWYSFTGVAGGSLWVLAVNLLLFSYIKSAIHKDGKRRLFLFISAVVLLVPLLISLAFSLKQKGIAQNQQEVVIVQPNIDPYNKIVAGTEQKQITGLLELTTQATHSNAALVLWPETALYSRFGYNEAALENEMNLTPVFQFLTSNPGVTLFTGIESYTLQQHPTPYSRLIPGTTTHFEAYNAAVLLDNQGVQATYHKSRLVPGVETLPWFLRFLDTWFEKFGGVTAGYAKQNERVILEVRNGLKLAPAICYESIYGNFMRQYIKKGANLITIITNDGWWKNTPGHRQHLHYARLRAVETGSWVARSANTGISAFIDPQGRLSSIIDYNQRGILKANIAVQQNNLTFYVRHGDWIFQFFCLATLLMLAKRFWKRFQV
ncbi:MAG: apolipoprotein N-acyltransferase [Bacteroidetes bacterium]|nr:apolipoprotein N-acyltransferase [Bacteroidota bacterium]